MTATEKIFIHQIIQIIISFTAMIIPVLLLLQVLHHKHKSPEIKVFIRMCFFNISLCLTYVINHYFNLEYLTNLTMSETIVTVVDFICNALSGILPLTLALHWLLFVEYTLHQSRDIIRRRYGFAQVLFIIGLLATLISSVKILPDSSTSWVYRVIPLVYRLRYLIWALFIAASYIILFNENKRMPVHQHIMPTPTVISIILGLILRGFIIYAVDVWGYGIGLMFADYYMFRRLRYIDPETGFFNQKYLPVYKRDAKKNNITEAMAIRFKLTGDSSAWVRILKSWKPEYCKIIIVNDGEYLLISETLKKAIAERFISLISDDYRKEGIELEATVETLTL